MIASLRYAGKKPESEILDLSEVAQFNEPWEDSTNKLIHGDNLPVMKALLERHDLRSKIDLVYIDPPFATNNKFTIGKERTSTISRSSSDPLAYSDELKGSSYLEFIRERLILIRELMSDKASIYLHIDSKIGHYVKLIMDEVFGTDNFRNDITRIKCNPKNFSRKSYGNIKDLILFYSKSDNYTWNDPKEQFSDDDLKRLFKKVDKSGRHYTTIPLHAPGETANGVTGKEWRGVKPPTGRHWRCAPELLEQLDSDGLIEWSSNGVPRKIIYADESEGKKVQDIWDCKDSQYPSYPTEKNLDMIKRIVSASSDPSDLVLDCFCGSGSTLQAANQLGRKWIGIDQSIEAVNVTRDRLVGLSSETNYQFLCQCNVDT